MRLSQKTFKFKDVKVGDYFMFKGRNYRKVQMSARMSLGMRVYYALDVDTGVLSDKVRELTDCTESMLQR